ncbi:hypothetical protein JCM19275_1714 [Nonlabens ulvanivorans]|uniref:Uncharacterized protein n=1 Tax=Nonlabens ulvanivorans TaxID=906888 RepID=A0A081DFH1_NONUL|nr:hypothetical protein JCM19296_3275 [Nonlabens ulvanivorans]GAL75831.1 hypothetical protein JCM19275_1714 [Nonlabens ulvanivorans]
MFIISHKLTQHAIRFINQKMSVHLAKMQNYKVMLEFI